MHSRVHFRPAVAALAALCLAAVTPEARGQDKGEEALRKLAAECQRAVTDARLDEALVRLRLGGDGALVVDAVVGSKTDLKKLEATVGIKLEKRKEGWKLGKIERIDWDASPARLQAALAASGRPLAERTRVDRVYLDYGADGEPELRLEVTCFDPSQQAKDDEARGQLLRDLRPACEQAAPAAGRWFKHRVLLASLNVPGDPAAAFQQALVRELKRDDVAINGARYDADGAIVLQGYVDNTDPQKALRAAEAFLRAHAKLAKHESLRPGLAEPWSLAGVKPSEWSVSPARVQAAFAASGKDELRQTRVERAYLQHAGGALKLTLEGTCLHKSQRAGDEKSKGQLTRYAREACEKAAAGPLAGLFKEVDTEQVRHVEQPDRLLQPEVSGEPDLDGVRLDDLSFFDAEGRLCLSGVWRGPAQAAALETLVAKKLAKQDSPLSAVKVGFTGMAAADSEGVLHRLRKWVADKLEVEEVWVQRLYFDEKGRLRVQILAPTGQAAAAEAQVRARLKQILDVHPQGKLFGPLAAPAEPAPPAGVGLVFAGDEAKLPSLAAELRKRFHGDKADAAGILIRRCFYDVDGTYVVSGLVDRDGQRAAVTATLQELADEDAWRPLLAKGRRVELKALPLRPMLDAAGAVLAAYAEFDGLRLAAGYHDADKKLVLTGYQVKGLGNPAAAEARLKRLLDADAVWSARSGGGVALKTEAVERNEALAELAVQRVADVVRKSLPDGASACDRRDPPLLLPPYQRGGKDQFAPLAKDVAAASLSYLNTALMHSPDDPTAWFLRAMCHLSSGDRVLAARDLRRLAALEEGRPYARADRLQKLEHVQGSLRMVAADFGDHVAIEAGAGRPGLTLAEVRGAAPQVMAALPGPSLAARAGAVAR